MTQHAGWDSNPLRRLGRTIARFHRAIIRRLAEPAIDRAAVAVAAVVVMVVAVLDVIVVVVMVVVMMDIIFIIKSLSRQNVAKSVAKRPGRAVQVAIRERRQPVAGLWFP